MTRASAFAAIGLACVLAAGFSSCGGADLVEVVSDAQGQVVEPTPDGGDRSTRLDPTATLGPESPAGARNMPTPEVLPEFVPAAVPLVLKDGLWCIQHEQMPADGGVVSLSRSTIERWANWGEWVVVDVARVMPPERNQLGWRYESNGVEFALNGFGGVLDAGFETVLANGTPHGMLQYFAPAEDDSWQLILICESTFHADFDTELRALGLEADKPGLRNKVLLGLLTDQYRDDSARLNSELEARLMQAIDNPNPDAMPSVVPSRWEERSRLERSFVDEDLPPEMQSRVEEVALSLDSRFRATVSPGNWLCFGTVSAVDYCFDPTDETLGLDQLTALRFQGEQIVVEEVQFEGTATIVVRTHLTLPSEIEPGTVVTVTLDETGQPTALPEN